MAKLFHGSQFFTLDGLLIEGGKLFAAKLSHGSQFFTGQGLTIAGTVAVRLSAAQIIRSQHRRWPLDPVDPKRPLPRRYRSTRQRLPAP
ncbi:MAG: hypothetical protein RMJ56_17960 [Gemmataceae bacterium]|nr:hypothetical protein [Gemmata sp.]MDW8199481.1 hypothetical protein [Gemmataceae bacterium]